MSEHPNLLVTDDDGVRVVTIDRPEAKNALDSAMRGVTPGEILRGVLEAVPAPAPAPAAARA